MFYIAQYPALYTLPRLADMFIPAPTRLLSRLKKIKLSSVDIEENN